jgi:hypothetical protein
MDWFFFVLYFFATNLYRKNVVKKPCLPCVELFMNIMLLETVERRQLFSYEKSDFISVPIEGMTGP